MTFDATARAREIVAQWYPTRGHYADDLITAITALAERAYAAGYEVGIQAERQARMLGQRRDA